MSIDLFDVIADPDLTNNRELQCYRRKRETRENGKAYITATPFRIWATVAPASGRQLQRLPEADRTSAGIALYTNTELIVEAQGFVADLVSWKNQLYLVGYVDDYSQDGFYSAIATLTKMTGPVPGTIPA